jgi:thioredoxin reductase
MLDSKRGAPERLPPACDVAVVGGGPAGLAAATWAARYRFRVVVLDSGEYRNRWVERAHGYLGSDPVGPAELLRRAREDLGQYPNAELVRLPALSVEREPAGRFHVLTEEGELKAERLVLATGTRDELPEVKGFFEHYGADVFHCPLCDGYEAQGRSVVVLGWSKDVIGFAVKLLNWAKEVRLLTEGRSPAGEEADRAELAEHGIELWEDDAAELIGRRGALEGVRLRSGSTLPCDLVFFSFPNRPVNDLARQLGCTLTEKGHVVIDEKGATSVEGVYAAGDLTPGTQLIQIAAAQGARAGLACATSLY